MAKIIPFESDFTSQPLYQKRLREIIAELDRLETESVDFCVNLATSGKWREWDAEHKNGDIFHFNEEMLKDTGDPNVDAVAELVDKIIATQEKLKSGLI